MNQMGKRAGREMAGAAEQAAESKTFERLARAGLVATGLIHVVIGFLALQLAFGGSKSENADPSGAVALLGEQPAGAFLLWFCFLGCYLLALYLACSAFFAGRREDGTDRWKEIAKIGGPAVVYAVLGTTFASFALSGGSDSSESSSTWSARLLSVPAGQWLLAAVGIGIAVVGGYFAYKGAAGRFRRDLGPLPGEPWPRVVTVTGTVGYIAKGVSLAAVGVLVFVAALQADPEQSSGLDGALSSLREQPMGPWLLAGVGLGLICYGLYVGIIKARFAKL